LPGLILMHSVGISVRVIVGVLDKQARLIVALTCESESTEIWLIATRVLRWSVDRQQVIQASVVDGRHQWRIIRLVLSSSFRSNPMVL